VQVTKKECYIPSSKSSALTNPALWVCKKCSETTGSPRYSYCRYYKEFLQNAV